ncbi:MAG: hypothetical protein AAFX06_14560, partial [Planctomycetota bacterium]
MATKRKKAKKRAKRSRTQSRTLFPSPDSAHMGPEELDALRQSIVGQIPLPEQDWPPRFAECLEEALAAAAVGQTELIEELVMAMVASMPPDIQERPPLCNASAAEVLREIDSSEDPGIITKKAQRALDLDPHAVDAMILLGDFATDEAEQVAYYRRASESAPHLDRELIRRVMPIARIHMASNLRSAGRLTEATEILVPALREAPEDENEVRVELSSLYLWLGWFDELEELVESTDEDELGVMAYARALAAFAAGGASRRSRALLQFAFELNGYAAGYLAGRLPMPQIGDPLSPEQQFAVQAAERLLPGLRSIDGAMAWIRN